MVNRLITNFIDMFYVAPLRRYIPITVYRYGACGGINMVLDTVWYFLIYHFIVGTDYHNILGITITPHILSLIIVFPITFLTGFYLNRNIAFRSFEVSTIGQMTKYLLTVLGSLLLNYILIKVFVEVMHIWPTPAKSLTTVVCVVYSYLVGRFYTFRK